ncbi:MAG: hypothetical protein ACXAC7_24005 [Candidatus Hodarchaeales archaeon]|jgi:hypothetical protein
MAVGNKEKKVKEVDLSDILNFSMISILILQLLLRYGIPMKRKALLEDMNSYLGAGSPVVTQTFYNQIEKLAIKGFIDYTKTRSGKIDKVLANDKTKQTMDKIAELSFFGPINMYKNIEDVLPAITSDIGLKSIPSMLIINLEEALDIRILNLLADNVDELYIVSDDDTYERYLARNLTPSINQTKQINGIIREPDNFFTVCNVMGYECGRSDDVSHQQWIKEAIRVTQTGGLLLVGSVENIPKSDHFLLDHVIKRIENTNYIIQHSKAELKEELSIFELENIQILSKKGMLVATAQVK